MDELDRKLLQLLRQDARLAMAELGRRIGLSRTATLARVRRLEAAGAIRGYHADIAEAGGAGHTARVGIIVGSTDLPAYVRRLADFPELTESERVAGGFDLLVRFCARDPARLHQILDTINGWRDTVRATAYVVITRDTRNGLTGRP